MTFDPIYFLVVLLLGLVSIILLISHDWRLSIGVLGLMYIGIFILVSLSLSVEMAVVKLVTGWISASVLGLSLVNSQLKNYGRNHYSVSEIVIQISAAILVVLVTISITPNVQNWLLEISYMQALGGLILIGMGFLHLGFSHQPFPTIIGLLTLFAGFEIIYAAVESSVLVGGLLAVINMGLALAGAYILLSPTLEVEG